MRLKLREFALVRDANGQLVEDGNNGGSGFKTAAKVGLGAAGVAGGAVLGTRWYHANKAYQAEGGIGKVYGDVKKMYAAGDSKGLQNLHGRLSSNAQASARAGWMGKLGKVGNVLTKFSANLAPALRELAARSGRIVEFGDGEADEAVIAALKAAASADETPAQRAMLLKRGLIEIVKGQLVINERGYDMMKKAGVPPKLTPEERREEIMGTEEKRLSRFNHGEHGGHGVEFARGDYLKSIMGRRGVPTPHIDAWLKAKKSPGSMTRVGDLPDFVHAMRGMREQGYKRPAFPFEIEDGSPDWVPVKWKLRGPEASDSYSNP